MIDSNSQFFAILTAVGEAKQANATALGTPWTFKEMAVGDANGTDPIPNKAQTRLLNEWRRAPVNQVRTDPANPNIIITEQVIPPDVGGRWIREIGLFDADGDLVAVANCAPSFKPLLVQGTGKTQVIRMNFIVASTAQIVLKIDPAVVLATREYVDSAVGRVLPKDKKPGEFTRVRTNDQGIVVSGDNPSTLAGMGIKDTYTKSEIESMVAKASSLPVGAVVAFPKASVPAGFLELDGSVQSVAVYPDLAAYLDGAFNKGDEGAGNFRLPESRGEFLRGWDHGRGVDPDRVLGSWQKGSLMAGGDNLSDHSMLISGLSDPARRKLPGWDEVYDTTLYYPTIQYFSVSALDVLVKSEYATHTGVSRPRNLSVMWCIKAWNAPVNQGQIDVANLALEIQKLKRMVPGMQSFSTPGIFNFVVPADAKADSVFVVEVWGGGGGGAGGSNGISGGGGGGGGGYSYKRLTGLMAGSVIKVTVGAGGFAGPSGAYGGSGGASSFDAYCSATGGAPGQYFAGSSPSSSGGFGSGGDLNLMGDLGKPSEYTVGGCGGMSPRGSGGGHGGYGAVGGAGGAPGGGGGGGDGPNFTGGAGASGMVTIRWR